MSAQLGQQDSATAMRATSGALERVTPARRGKNPDVLFADADLSRAVAGAPPAGVLAPTAPESVLVAL